MPKKDSRLLLAKFNDQMERLYELLRIVEDIRLAPEVLEPDPVDIVNNAIGEKKNGGPQSGDMNDGKWSGEASRGGGFRMEDQQVNITFGEEQQKEKVKKEVPTTWIKENKQCCRCARKHRAKDCDLKKPCHVCNRQHLSALRR